MRFKPLVVILVILLNTVFTGAILYLFLVVGNEPKVLIGAWFGFTTVELWALAGITKEQIRTAEENRIRNRDM